jgi:phosphoribosyl-ATP pyrophosphohydrolase/phosphoribosyl-AMP cyclohydrolase
MKQPDFGKQTLIPAIIQDAKTRKVLMLGYMNEEAYYKTLETNLITFFSRSKKFRFCKKT